MTSNSTPVIPTTFTLKLQSLYVAYAPEFGLRAYGACQDEALNNLTDEIRERDVLHSTGNDKSSYAFN